MSSLYICINVYIFSLQSYANYCIIATLFVEKNGVFIE